MSEPEGRANHDHGSVSFLATKWRALIGARKPGTEAVVTTSQVVHR